MTARHNVVIINVTPIFFFIYKMRFSFSQLVFPNCYYILLYDCEFVYAFSSQVCDFCLFHFCSVLFLFYALARGSLFSFVYARAHTLYLFEIRYLLLLMMLLLLVLFELYMYYILFAGYSIAASPTVLLEKPQKPIHFASTFSITLYALHTCMSV